MIAISLGPAFIVMIQAGMNFGSRSAMYAAAGIILGDVLLCCVAVFGLARFVSEPINQLYLGIGSGLLLIGFGIAGFITSRNPLNEAKAESDKMPAKRLFAKTFLINNSNPFNWLYWIAIAGFARASSGYGENGFVLFFIGVWLCVLISTILKAKLSLRLGKWLQGNALHHINQVAAAIFLIIGLGIIVRSLI